MGSGEQASFVTLRLWPQRQPRSVLHKVKGGQSGKWEGGKKEQENTGGDREGGESVAQQMFTLPLVLDYLSLI